MYKTVDDSISGDILIRYFFTPALFVEKDSYGDWVVVNGTHGDSYRTEEEAVAAWMELWNEEHKDYYRSSKRERLHADLTDLARHKLENTSPLEIIERKKNCDYIYDLKGCIEMTDLTEDDLIDVLESIEE